jgi:hypothetical protein
MKHQPSGIQTGLTLLIDKEWTPEQAMAVFELLNDLKEVIWSHYDLTIQQYCQEHRCTKEPFPEDKDPQVPF